MKKRLLIGMFILSLMIVVGCSSTETSSDAESSFQYIKATEFKAKLDADEPVIILDFRKKADFDKEHIKNSVGTGIFPVDTEEMKQDALEYKSQLNDSDAPIILVCYKGKVASENAFNLYKDNGIDVSRLFILEGGIDGWSYDEYLEK